MPARIIIILMVLLYIEGRVLTKKLCYNCNPSAAVNTTGISSSSDICASVDPDGFSTIASSLTKGTKTSMTQSECVKYFKFELNDPLFIDTSISFEVQFKNFPSDPLLTPVFVERLNDLPIIWRDNQNQPQQLADDLDLNAYVNRKSYHYIRVNTSRMSVGDTIYVGVYKYFQDSSEYYQNAVEYTIKADAEPKCPNSCSGNGICLNYQCYCDPGVFDLDCSAKAEKASLNNPQSFTIATQGWAYQYLVINDDSVDMRLNFTKNQGVLKSYMIFNEQNEYDLPNYALNTGVFNLQETQSGDFWVITDLTLRKNLLKTMLIGFYNPNSEAITVEFAIIQSPDKDAIKTTIMYIMIGVSAFLIVLWGVITIVKYKVQRDHEISEQSSQQNESEQQDILSIEELDKFFPQKAFKDLKSSFDQPTCSICLDEYQPETLCRQIYCEHIYHCKCIESWLSQHKSCPNCKKEVTKNAIEAFLDEIEKIKNQIKIIEEPKVQAKLELSQIKIDDKAPANPDPIEEKKENNEKVRKPSFEVQNIANESDNKKPVQRMNSANSESQLEIVVEFENNHEKNIPISNDPKENASAINLSNKV